MRFFLQDGQGGQYGVGSRKQDRGLGAGKASERARGLNQGNIGLL
jgi:hypothetical protein